MSRVERNAEIQAKKKRSARLTIIRDCAVVLVCLLLVLTYVSSTSQITTEPEYAYAGGTSKEIPVFLIGIPIDEETTEETGADGQEKQADQDGQEKQTDQDDHEAEPVVVGKLVRGSTVRKLIDFKEIDGVMY